MKEMHILLVDDDKADRVYFARALAEIEIPSRLIEIEGGEKLMGFLNKSSNKLPDVIFLDYNMRGGNGGAYLAEIKKDERFKNIPVIIFAPPLLSEVADVLFQNGAHACLQKCSQSKLTTALYRVLAKVINKSLKPSRRNFVINGTTPSYFWDSGR